MSKGSRNEQIKECMCMRAWTESIPQLINLTAIRKVLYIITINLHQWQKAFHIWMAGCYALISMNLIILAIIQFIHNHLWIKVNKSIWFSELVMSGICYYPEDWRSPLSIESRLATIRLAAFHPYWPPVQFAKFSPTINTAKMFTLIWKTFQ